MTGLVTSTPTPIGRRDLVLSAPGRDGSVVVKDPKSGAYFNLGAQEAFLLRRLDGTKDADEVCEAFGVEFDERLTREELDDFFEIARQRSLLEGGAEAPAASGRGRRLEDEGDEDDGSAFRKGERLNVLNWRINFYDPDRLFGWLAPRLGFLWTPGFVVISALAVTAAASMFALNWAEYRAHVADSLNLETVLLAYLGIFAATTLHEFAHGLTCKRHGGEVHELGFLMLLFMPCFYCNVSDAWLIRDKAKRLWVTLAGAYCDLCVWALAVFIWRLSLPGSWPYRIAVVLMAVCGVRAFLNFTPVIKLDGYYLLSDWMEIPNLRRKARLCMTAHVRWLLWGAERPAPEANGRFLLAYGVACWLFLTTYLGAFVASVFHFSWQAGGLWAGLQLGIVGWLLAPSVTRDFSKGEATKMFLKRHKRVAFWLGGLGLTAGLLAFFPMPDRAGGPFRIRPAARLEIRAPAAGFLKAVYGDEGAGVESGAAVVLLEIPDLDSKRFQKNAEINESQAKLALLQAGTRPEELREQREKVQRASHWKELAKRDLDRQNKALTDEMVALKQQIARAKAELEFAVDAEDRGRKLLKAATIPLEKYRELDLAVRVARAGFESAQAKQHERETVGALEQERELAKCDKALADAVGALVLMEAGSRPEDIAAEKARLSRLMEERKYLDLLHARLRMTSPLAGTIVTPRLAEKVGHYFKEGELICEIQALSQLEAEIHLEEQLVSKVGVGQKVDFKARALPWAAFHGTVKSVGAAAAPDEAVKSGEPIVLKSAKQNVFVITADVETRPPEIRPGMTGYARISCGSCSLGQFLGGSLVRYLRTEFWW